VDKVAPYYKAVAGALVAFLTAISTSLDDGTLTAQDWVGAVIALVVGFGAVFTIPNIASNYSSTAPVVPDTPEPEPVKPEPEPDITETDEPKTITPSARKPPAPRTPKKP
jgi:hypothetical protein